jgi:hypothetical protein
MATAGYNSAMSAPKIRLPYPRPETLSDPYRRRRNARVRALLEDETLAARHAPVVRERLPTYDPNATYWRDLFSLLGIAQA